MALEIQGKLLEKFETMQVTEKFKKREFVLEVDDNGYTQYVKFQLNQDKCSLIDQHALNDVIKVSFNLSGRPYTKKTGEKDYITNIVAWKIDRLGAQNADNAVNPVAGAGSFQLNQSDSEDDNLPF